MKMDEGRIYTGMGYGIMRYGSMSDERVSYGVREYGWIKFSTGGDNIEYGVVEYEEMEYVLINYGIFK